MALTGAERKRRYRERHPDRIREQNRVWREANPEKKQKANASWRNTNPRPEQDPERARECAAIWYRENKDRRAQTSAAWRRANPDKVAEYQRRRRARKLGTDPDLTPEQWNEILDEFGHRCAYCASDGPLERDHVWPISRGGRHTRDNVVPACRSCNASKGSRILAEWMRFVQ